MYKTFLMLLTLKYANLQMSGNVYGGDSSTGMEGFILDGAFSKIEWYPHQVYLELYGYYDCICGGSVLNQAIIVTAAHCFDDFIENEKQSIIIKYGSEDINEMNMAVGSAYKIHENYDITTMYGDIALVRCKTPLQLEIVKKVAIMKNPPKSKMAYVSGWGAMNENMELSDSLKYAEQELQDERTCSKISLPTGAFCAGPINGPGNPGIGDSGGALVIEKYIQIGIVSYKVEKYTLVAYTNVSYHYAWISKYAATLYCYY